jgi:hypothetical protein
MWHDAKPSHRFSRKRSYTLWARAYRICGRRVLPNFQGKGFRLFIPDSDILARCSLPSRHAALFGLDRGMTHHKGRITKAGRRDLRYALVIMANNAVEYHPFWKQEFERLSRRMERGKAIVAIARRLLVAVWHVLSKEEADRHAVAVDVARSLFGHAYRVGVRNLPHQQSAVEFTRNQLDRLGIGREVEYIPWGTKRPKLPPSRLPPQQQKK